MKRITVSILLLSVICCSLICVFWDGYYLPNKPCRPITYPEGKRITRDMTYSTSDSIESVLLFFDRELDIKPIGIADTGDWSRGRFKREGFLYSCYGGDINLITVETGCIYVSKDEDVTIIQTIFLRGEGANTPCPHE